MAFADLGLKIPEADYHARSEISYSQLQNFDREGFDYLDHKDDGLDTPYLTFGSMVDCLITQPEGTFDKEFVACEINITDSVAAIIKAIADSTDDAVTQFALVEDDVILQAAKDANWYNNWKDTTRVSKIREQGSEYFNFLKKNSDKTVVSKEDMDDAKACADALKNDSITGAIFAATTDANIEQVYQLQLLGKFNYTKDADGVAEDVSIPVKGMLDFVVVDNTNKTIQPYDLKTSKSVYTFEDSFYKYRYYLQAEMYTELLKQAIATTEQYKDYTILPYKFIVVDRVHKKPVVFLWNTTSNVKDKYGQVRKACKKLAFDFHNALTGANLPYEWEHEIKDGKNSAVTIQNYYTA